NVQRAVLARELSEPVTVLIAANPVFGLDFAAVVEIHDRILAARNAGAAVLLVSEDLDELLELSDRIAVIFGGRIVHETATAKAIVRRSPTARRPSGSEDGRRCESGTRGRWGGSWSTASPATTSCRISRRAAARP